MNEDDPRQLKIRLDGDTHNRLRHMAADLDTSMNALVQDAILDILDDHEKEHRQ